MSVTRRDVTTAGAAGEGSSAKKAAHDNGAAEQLETVTILLTVFTEGDVLVLASQCLLLGVIIWTLQFGLPAEIAGFACIVIATVMMLFLGVISSFKEIRDFVEEHAEDLQHLGNKVRAWYYRGGRRAEALRAQLATKVNIIVPDLGITFSGETQDAEEATHEEGLAKLTKKVAYYVHHRAARDGSCPRSVRELPRFKSDIRSSLSIALDMDQMMLRKKIPQIVATLQCVNHVGTSDCCAKNDTYLTLFKPEDWMPEFDTDIQKKEEMLLGWQKQVHRWMKDTLGAVDHARTCARQIQDEIAFNLRKDIMGSKHRTRLKVKVGSIRLPRDGLDGKLAYVTVLDELESIIPTREGGFPTDRTSGFARLQGRPARCCFLPELGAEIDVPVPAYKTKVRLCVWAQVKDGVDELVGFTNEVDLSEHVRAGDDEDLDGDGLGGTGSATLVLHTRWAARGGALVPLCGEEGTAGEAGRERPVMMAVGMAVGAGRRDDCAAFGWVAGEVPAAAVSLDMLGLPFDDLLAFHSLHDKVCARLRDGMQRACGRQTQTQLNPVQYGAAKVPLGIGKGTAFGQRGPIVAVALDSQLVTGTPWLEHAEELVTHLRVQVDFCTDHLGETWRASLKPRRRAVRQWKYAALMPAGGCQRKCGCQNTVDMRRRRARLARPRTSCVMSGPGPFARSARPAAGAAGGVLRARAGGSQWALRDSLDVGPVGELAGKCRRVGLAARTWVRHARGEAPAVYAPQA
ncbi:unnamed protein product [Prorocentrum cordatum]|uniref:Uncharacterized protein n=1 Tax=Prorocentrum cordatum TaxID=2364126 RepID=A0ABN9TAV5_9DINO|nr:unnamed protein product [Polarella glacialis]